MHPLDTGGDEWTHGMAGDLALDIFNDIITGDQAGRMFCPMEPSDTVGQPPGAEICVSNMPSLKAKRLRKLPQEKVLLEL